MLVDAIAASALFAWSNRRYAEWLVPLLGAQSQLARGLVFSSLPLLLALSVAVWRPLM